MKNSDFWESPEGDSKFIILYDVMSRNMLMYVQITACQHVNSSTIPGLGRARKTSEKYEFCG